MGFEVDDVLDLLVFTNLVGTQQAGGPRVVLVVR